MRKSWSNSNKAKSVNKYNKSKNEKKISKDEDFSKKTILTLINDNKNILKEKLNNENIEIEKDKNKEETKINLVQTPTYFDGKETNNDYKNFEENLLINLHKTNMRRTIDEKDRIQTQKSIQELISETKDNNRLDSKRLSLPNNKDKIKDKGNENTNENIEQNISNKVPII